jgi:hypothetical protein
LCNDLVDGLLIRRGARARTAQAEIDDLRRGRIVRRTGNREARSPAHAGDDVAIGAAAFAEHPHRQDQRVPASPGDPFGVVRQRGDQARNTRAMPGTVHMVAAGRRRTCRDVEGRLRQLGRRHEVAGVAGIGIAAVAVIRERHVENEIETVEELTGLRHPQQIRMLEAHAGIDDRNDGQVAADRYVPRLVRARGRNLGALEVPLIREQRIVGHCVRPAMSIGNRVLDVRICRQAFEQRVQLVLVERAIELQYVCLDGDLLLAL